ncbi:MAG TPA: integrin alpha [Kofleriaceae bacterium]|nr:integrin alpha [Kofleriaceae bacterium]
MLLDGRRAVTVRARACAAAGLLTALLGGCGGGDAPCAGPTVDGACRALRIAGIDPHGELGFRFGEPMDLDGDGRADVVGGSRLAGAGATGEAAAWSADGTLLHRWPGVDVDGLFGNVVTAVPDLDGDGRADVIVSAPNAVVDGALRGFVEAYRLDGGLIWRAVGEVADGFGWQVAGAGDRDGDGVEDLWVGAPSNTVTAHVYLLSGASGAVIDTIASAGTDDAFGFYLAAVDDLDGDGVRDLAIGAPAASVDGVRAGAVVLVSGATRAVLRTLHGEEAGSGFGAMLAPMDDVDGDGVGDVAIGAPADADPTTPARAEVQLFSGATGARLRRLSSPDDGDYYGRALARTDDLDGDGVRDLAIGVPWWHGLDGRFEVRSARTFALLADVHGSEAGWLGWYLAAADGGVLAASLHLDDDRGAIDLYLLR